MLRLYKTWAELLYLEQIKLLILEATIQKDQSKEQICSFWNLSFKNYTENNSLESTVQ